MCISDHIFVGSHQCIRRAKQPWRGKMAASMRRRRVPRCLTCSIVMRSLTRSNDVRAHSRSGETCNRETPRCGVKSFDQTLAALRISQICKCHVDLREHWLLVVQEFVCFTIEAHKIWITTIKSSVPKTIWDSKNCCYSARNLTRIFRRPQPITVVLNRLRKLSCSTKLNKLLQAS